MKINHLRKEYSRLTLSRNDLKTTPLSQLKIWLEDALSANVLEPNAMFLATVDKQGMPSSRIVLLKEIEENGLLFFTNYRSKKGRDIEDNPYGSATFFWKELERQATFFGQIVKVDEERSQNYFATRPRASQLAAWASKQGEKASSRSEIDEAYTQEEKKWEGREITKPPYWGGFLLMPSGATFWQGREKRLHDHFLYSKNSEGTWDTARLYP
ncbi:pyridoxamine 5'-phosphate oxidase [Estrella lausannensis]|nr:pyridoxamine 5'-phosphate oxidase [Estrella lausannensis]